MAKISNSDKHGSVGPSTFQRSPHGLIERIRNHPIDPKTHHQLNQRAALAMVAQSWRQIPEAARPGWASLARQLRGNLHAQQAFCQVNAVLVKYGLPLRETAPAVPAFGQLTCGELLVDDSPSIKLLQVREGSGADSLVIAACKPLPRGISSVGNRFRHLTVVAGPAGAAVDLDLTAAYLARFCEPYADEQVFMRITPMTNGFLGQPLQLRGLVTARAE